MQVIVRDLWALRLQVLTSTLPENISSQAPGSQRSQRSQRQQTEEEGYSSQSSYLYSSDSDVASTTYSSRKRRARRVPKAADRPKLVESLALCYLGTILLRSAVSLGELHRWVEAGKLPFIRAIKQVPPAMKAKLSAEYRGALEPRTNLLGGKLYKTVHSTVAMLHEQFGITFPPINREVLLGRMVNELGLPRMFLSLSVSWISG